MSKEEAVNEKMGELAEALANRAKGKREILRQDEPTIKRDGLIITFIEKDGRFVRSEYDREFSKTLLSMTGQSGPWHWAVDRVTRTNNVWRFSIHYDAAGPPNSIASAAQVDIYRIWKEWSDPSFHPTHFRDPAHFIVTTLNAAGYISDEDLDEALGLAEAVLSWK